MKRRLSMAVAVLLLVSGTVAVAKIGSGSEVATALGITVAELERMQTAVGTHQKLVDDRGEPRLATVLETVKEMVGRMNDLVIREEDKARRAAVEAQLAPIKEIEVE